MVSATNDQLIERATVLRRDVARIKRDIRHKRSELETRATELADVERQCQSRGIRLVLVTPHTTKA